ncbi:MAG: hypothetical protein H6699_00590 [Myxococcales bacterium]|nr:hypothetical protein [Myxococcales bacterium]
MRPNRGAVAIAASAFAALLTGSLGPHAALAQSLSQSASRADATLTTLRGQLTDASNQYLRPEQVLREQSFSAAFSNARYLYATGDWANCATQLYDAVEDEGNASNPSYAEARFMLGDSLFHERNYLGARRYLEGVTSGPFVVDATLRRLEIAIALGQRDALSGLNAELDRVAGSSDSSRIAYVRGKGEYYDGDYTGAATRFEQVSPSSAVYDMAQYMLGVTYARLGRLGDARSAFVAIQSRLASSTDSAAVEIRELAILGEGRIYYEEQDWLSALDAYLRVPRGSARYPDALYETSWTQIQQGNVVEDDDVLQRQYWATALNNLQILTLVTNRNSRFMAEAQLVRGDLLMRIARYDEAVQEFQSVADQFFPVEAEMREIVERHDDLSAFLDAAVNANSGTLRLPSVVQPWLQSDERLNRALGSLQDVEGLQGEIDEARQLIARLDAALNTGARVNAFPRSREGWGRVLEIQGSATELATQLVDAAAATVVPRIDAQSNVEYTQLHARRVELQRRVASLPRTFAAYDEREHQAIADLNQRILDVHRSELQIQAARADLEALRQMYFDGDLRTREDSTTVRARMNAEERRLDEQEAAAEALRNDLLVRQVAVGLGDGANATERAARAEFMSALGDEAAFLASRRSAAPGDSGAFDDVARILRDLRQLDADCEGFYVQIDRLVVEQTAALRDQLERERASIERDERLLATASVDVQRTAGQVAYAAFNGVYERFSNLTLRASLGVLDVAWHQKEALTDSIDDLFEERNQSLRELDADFAELLEDHR